MCILSYIPAGVSADTDDLMNGGLANPDGHGWAIAAGSRMIVGKSLDLIEALETFEKAHKNNPGSPALFHSRWATHGSVSVDNVHPFVMGGSRGRTVVAHNGILPRSAHPAKGDDRSDTRLFADDILSTRYRRLDRTRARQAMADWIGSYNKLVILTVDNPRYQRNAYLINSSAGIWDVSGVWHSNGDYLGRTSWTGTLGNSTSAWTGTAKKAAKALTAKPAELCYICEMGSIGKDGFCITCGACEDCLEDRRDCQCWNRAYWSKGETQRRWAAEYDEWRAEQDQLITPDTMPIQNT